MPLLFLSLERSRIGLESLEDLKGIEVGHPWMGYFAKRFWVWRGFMVHLPSTCRGKMPCFTFTVSLASDCSVLYSSAQWGRITLNPPLGLVRSH